MCRSKERVRLIGDTCKPQASRRNTSRRESCPSTLMRSLTPPISLHPWIPRRFTLRRSQAANNSNTCNTLRFNPPWLPLKTSSVHRGTNGRVNVYRFSPLIHRDSISLRKCRAYTIYNACMHSVDRSRRARREAARHPDRSRRYLNFSYVLSPLRSIPRSSQLSSFLPLTRFDFIDDDLWEKPDCLAF